jgi:hypothetical protein
VLGRSIVATIRKKPTPNQNELRLTQAQQAGNFVSPLPVRQRGWG